MLIIGLFGSSGLLFGSRKNSDNIGLLKAKQKRLLPVYLKRYISIKLSQILFLISAYIFTYPIVVIITEF